MNHRAVTANLILLTVVGNSVAAAACAALCTQSCCQPQPHKPCCSSGSHCAPAINCQPADCCSWIIAKRDTPVIKTVLPSAQTSQWVPFAPPPQVTLRLAHFSRFAIVRRQPERAAFNFCIASHAPRAPPTVSI